MLCLCSALQAGPVPLTEDALQPIRFKRIAPNTVHFFEGVLQIEVDRSASFHVYPLDSVTTVKRVAFRWRGCGSLNRHDARHEASREGDDAWLRVGLIHEGKAQLLNPFAPQWIRQTRDTLKHPGGGMTYLVAGALHEPGESWTSPYNSEIRMIAAGDSATDDGWRVAEHRFAEPVRAVGIWIMADGDNTGSTFTSQLKDLVIE